MVTEFRPPVSQSSTRMPKFMPPLFLNSNYTKLKLKIGYPCDSIKDRLYWKPAAITTTLCSTTNGRGFTHLSIKSCNNPGDI